METNIDFSMQRGVLYFSLGFGFGIDFFWGTRDHLVWEDIWHPKEKKLWEDEMAQRLHLCRAKLCKAPFNIVMIFNTVLAKKQPGVLNTGHTKSLPRTSHPKPQAHELHEEPDVAPKRRSCPVERIRPRVWPAPFRPDKGMEATSFAFTCRRASSRKRSPQTRAKRPGPAQLPRLVCWAEACRHVRASQLGRRRGRGWLGGSQRAWSVCGRYVVTSVCGVCGVERGKRAAKFRCNDSSATI